MNTLEKINQLFLEAMRKKDDFALAPLRMLKAGLKNKSIELIKELSEEEIISVIRSEMKKRKDSVEAYEKGGREDLAKQEKDEMTFLNQFLPAQMTSEQIKEAVLKALDGLSEEDKKNFGKVMSAVMAQTKGQADGSSVSAAVKEMLAVKQ
ncbi:MAG: GatB/YqeY domain-containing protein [Patescibacteria group bacterium]